MSNRPDLIMSLGKVLIAAAWSDHDLAIEEVNSLKDLLFHLPGLTANQWAELEIYLHSPVKEAERERLVAELQRQIRSERDRKLALNALTELVEADGELGQEERATFDQIRSAIEEANTGVIGAVGSLMTSAVRRRSQAAADYPNREDRLGDFVRNRVYYSVRQRLRMGEAELSSELSEDRLRTLSLAGGLMARVAHVDEQVSDDELAAMVKALHREWDLTDEEAAFVAGVAVTEIASDLDGYRLSREFYEATSREDRLRFLEVLFEVAAADGQASHQEIEDIRSIARTLKLTHREFIEAKLTLPKDKRAS